MLLAAAAIGTFDTISKAIMFISFLAGGGWN